MGCTICWRTKIIIVDREFLFISAFLEKATAYVAVIVEESEQFLFLSLFLKYTELM